MAGRMKMAALACLLSATTACQRFAPPEERINAAMPVAAETLAAKQAFDELARARSFDAQRIDNAFRDKLKVRALECAQGYSPSWLHGEDKVRAQLGDSACFEAFDQSLAQWIGLRHAGLLLAAPPLRPIPAQPAPYLVAGERISETSFARKAGIAVLHTGKQHEVFDLGSGERLQKIAREGRNFVVDISDNGRLLSLRQEQSVVVLDLERGKLLLRLDEVRDQRLFWVGEGGALYVPEKERAPVFTDLLNGRESRIPASINSVNALAPTPLAERYALLGFNRHAAIDLRRDAQGWNATLAQEAEPAQTLGHWPRANFNADAGTYIGHQNGLVLLDLRSLQARRIALAPLMIGTAVPTPDPDQIYLFGHYRTGGGTEYQALLYSPGKHTLAPAQIGKRLSSTVVYVPSIKRNALRDDFKLTLLDSLPSSDAPVDADAYLQRLPAVEATPTPASADNPAYAAAIARALRDNGIAGTDPALAIQAKVADIEAVGVYEGEGAVHGPGSSARKAGTVQVQVKRGRPVILVLTSYEPVNWIVKPEPGAKVLAVLQGGYHPSQVHGVGDTQITRIGRSHAYKRGDASFERLDAEVRQRAGKPIGRFQGTYRGNQFQVGGGS